MLHHEPRTARLTTFLFISSALLVACSSSVPTSPKTTGESLVADASQGVPSTGAARRAEEAVQRADAAEVSAFLANDPTALARLWGENFVVTNPFNQFLNKQQVLALVTSGTLGFSAYDRHIDYVRAYGDVVVVAGRETVVWAGHMPLTGQTSNLRYTAVWARHGDDWQEVARHASMVLAGGPPGP